MLATTEEAKKAPSGAITIKVNALKFIPNQITVEAGTVTFFLDTTKGLYPHNMLIGEGPTAATAPLATSDPFETTDTWLALGEGPGFDDYLSGSGLFAEQALNHLSDRPRERRGVQSG